MQARSKFINMSLYFNKHINFQKMDEFDKHNSKVIHEGDVFCVTIQPLCKCNR